MNFLEEHNESVVEKLAARFKTEEILEKFQRVVTKCLSLMNTENGNVINVTSLFYICITHY